MMKKKISLKNLTAYEINTSRNNQYINIYLPSEDERKRSSDKENRFHQELLVVRSKTDQYTDTYQKMTYFRKYL